MSKAFLANQYGGDLPESSVLIIHSVGYSTLQDSQSTAVPTLTAAQVTSAYNAITADKVVYIEDSLGDNRTMVLQKAPAADKITIYCSYLSRLELSYTINGSAVDIAFKEIGAGSGGTDYIATYETTTFLEIEEAINAGKTVFVRIPGNTVQNYYPFDLPLCLNTDSEFVFSGVMCGFRDGLLNSAYRFINVSIDTNNTWDYTFPKIIASNQAGYGATDTPLELQSNSGRSWLKFLKANGDFLGSIGADSEKIPLFRKTPNGNNSFDVLPLLTHISSLTLSNNNTVKLNPGIIFFFPDADAQITITNCYTTDTPSGDPVNQTVNVSGTCAGLATRKSYTRKAGTERPEEHFRFTVAYTTGTLSVFSSSSFLCTPNSQITIKCRVAGGRTLYVIGDQDISSASLV